MTRQSYPTENGVVIRSRVQLSFEESYLRLLRMQNRIYSDAEVRELPKTFFYNLHRQEWAWREKSMLRILKYLKKVAGPLKVLDLGCGNGWLSSRIAQQQNREVEAVDVALYILEQAARLWQMPNVQFHYGRIEEDIFPAKSFDLIVLNQSIEFFPDLQALVDRCFYFLKSGGEIHILDSPLYNEKEREAKEKEIHQQFHKLGIPEMADQYFLHSKNDLQAYQIRYMTKPGPFTRKSQPPHPWVRIICE
ncbi:MAG: class I SAM-dependent methyltransferase [Bacteroidota bacterium]